MKKVILFLAFISICSVGGFAQQRAQSSLDHVNTFNLNNSYAGLDSCIHIFGQRKQQWIGIDGAPVNTQLQGYLPLARTWGAGLEVANWNAGLLSATNVAGTIAKHLALGSNLTLSAALSLGYYQYSFGTEDVIAFDSDSYFDQSRASNGGLYGDLGFLLNTDRLEVGVALPRVFGTAPSFEIGSETNEFDVEGYLNAHASYRLTLNSNFDLTPMVIYRSIPSNGSIVDVRAGLMYKRALGVNLGFRTNNGLIAAVDYTWNDRIKLGYAYDAGMNQLNGISSGSHEFLLGFQLCKPRKEEESKPGKHFATGTVKDSETGETMQNVALTFENLNTSEKETVTTDKDGAYKLKVDETSNYKVTAQPLGYEPLSQTIAISDELDNTVTDLALTHQKIGVTGAVVDAATNTPLSDVSVMVKNDAESYSAITDAEGKFSVELENKRPGEMANYSLELSKPGYEPASESISKKIENYEELALAPSSGGAFQLTAKPKPVEKPMEEKPAEEPVKVKPAPKPVEAPREVIPLAPILFEFNSAQITELAKIRLERVVREMKANPDMEVLVESHTDCKGSEAANQVLSERRARATAKYIQSRITNPERVTWKGMGESKPVEACECADCTDEQQAKNRRTEFVILK